MKIHSKQKINQGLEQRTKVHQPIHNFRQTDEYFDQKKKINLSFRFGKVGHS